MIWGLIFFILILLVPILSIVLDSSVGRAIAARLEQRSLAGSDDLLADRMAFLEGEVERLNAEVKRLDDESQFLHRLLVEGREDRPALPKGERAD